MKSQLQQGIAVPITPQVVIHSLNGKPKPSLHASMGQDSCCILGLPSHPVGWSHSRDTHSVEHLDPQTLWKAWGEGGLNIVHQVAPDKKDAEATALRATTSEHNM